MYIYFFKSHISRNSFYEQKNSKNTCMLLMKICTVAVHNTCNTCTLSKSFQQPACLNDCYNT